jgi:class 3 adenylate cyclase
MAMTFAADHPDRVSALVLSNTFARYAWADDLPTGMTPAAIDAQAGLVAQFWGTSSGFASNFPALAGDPAEMEAFGRLRRAAATPAMAAATYRRIFEETDVRADLIRVLAPTLVIATNKVPDVRYLVEHIAGARTVSVASRGTLLFGDDFELAISEVASFLTGRHLDQAPLRKLVTVMITDIAASTERLAAAGDQHWRDVLDGHDRAVRVELQRFGGREVNTTGDGFIAAFESPTAAVRCGERIVASLAELGIEVRVGLHTGECEVRGDDLAGMAVHIAARVAATARPGEVVVSKSLADLVLGSGLEFDDRGTHELKGVPGSWALVALRQ